MITYRCKCGKCVIHSSMGVMDCETCPDCGSTFATHPDHHPNPIPHQLELVFSTKSGKPDYYRCIRCYKRIEIIEVSKLVLDGKAIIVNDDKQGDG